MELSPAARRLVILLCLRHLPGILGMRSVSYTHLTLPTIRLV